MKFVIVGAGYTGLSVIKRLSKNNTMYISRTRNESLSYDCEIIDLDNDINPIKIEIPYTLLYTVPPNPRMEIDFYTQLKMAYKELGEEEKSAEFSRKVEALIKEIE